MNRFTSHFLFLQLALVAGSMDERSLTIMNQSGKRMEVHWVPPYEGELVLQSEPDLLSGASLTLNSFVSHTFQVRELPNRATSVCTGEENQCHVGSFTVNSHENQDHTDTGSIALVSASKIVDTCLQNTKTALPSSLSDQDKSAAIELMSSCIQSSTAKQIEIAHEEVQFQSEIRTDMSHMLENYTCYDETLSTSKAKTTTNWMARHVDVMLDRPSAKIHFISDFITQEECDAIHWEVKNDLKDADVSDGRGGRTLDAGRSAKTAPIRNVNDASHARLIEQLSRRIYDYTNHVLPFNVTDEGQQDLMFIQYYGRGINNKKPDRYLPRCDGDCDGRAFKDGGRIATMLMYCDIAKRGGATNFMNAGITVRPKKYSATFFSYINPGTMMMDDGLTQHSG